MMNNMGDLMKKAQQMQEQMQKAQEEIAKANPQYDGVQYLKKA